MPKARSTTWLAGCTRVAFKQMSVMLLMAIPGAISIHRDAMPRTGGKPRPVTPMKAASCGCKLSRNAYVRSTMERGSAMAARLLGER